MARITLDGVPFETIGVLPRVGSQAPDFRLATADLSDAALSDYAGKRKVLSILPSLATSVCATMAGRFNREAASLENTVVLVVSADLAFAQTEFCGAHGLDDVVTLSMMRGKGFAKDYGVLITGGPFEGLCARAVVVLDEQNVVIHAQLVPEIGDEPDYEAALASLRR